MLEAIACLLLSLVVWNIIFSSVQKWRLTIVQYIRRIWHLIWNSNSSENYFTAQTCGLQKTYSIEKHILFNKIIRFDNEAQYSFYHVRILCSEMQIEREEDIMSRTLGLKSLPKSDCRAIDFPSELLWFSWFLTLWQSQFFSFGPCCDVMLRKFSQQSARRHL